MRCCNTCLADGSLGAGGRSARQCPDIYLDGCGTHLSFLSSSSLRPEPSGARALAPSTPPSVDLSHPATKPRFLAQEPSSAPPPPSPTPRLASYGRNHPRHHRSPLEVLKALLHHRSASPVIFHSNRPREWIRGEFLVLPGLFPLPWCVAGAGERPPPPPPLHLLSPVRGVKS